MTDKASKKATSDASQIPMVLRSTGRTIPDLTKREHVCEYQARVNPSQPAPALAAERERSRKLLEALPRIICLCGSTRFYEYFQRANYEETMAGRIVLSVGFYPHAQTQMHHEDVGCTPEQKIALDELHKRKIDLCDEVFVLNVGGYIGSSTRSEIEYAAKIGRPIRYLEPLARAAIAEAEKVVNEKTS